MDPRRIPTLSATSRYGSMAHWKVALETKPKHFPRALHPEGPSPFALQLHSSPSSLQILPSSTLALFTTPHDNPPQWPLNTQFILGDIFFGWLLIKLTLIFHILAQVCLPDHLNGRNRSSYSHISATISYHVLFLTKHHKHIETW